MSTETFRKYPSNLSTLFLIGYILRMIPYIQIVGAAITAVSWGMLKKKWINDPRLVLPIIGSILVLSGHILGVLVGTTTMQGVSISTNPASTTEAIDSLIQVVDVMIDQLSNIYSMLSPLTIGIGIMLEAAGLYFLREHVGQHMPVYIILGLVILAIIYVVTPIAYIQTIHGLEEYKKILLDVKENPDKYSSGQLQEIILVKMLSAMMPLVIIGLVSLVASIVAYLLVALRFNSFKKLKKEAIILEEGTIREEEEEILI